MGYESNGSHRHHKNENVSFTKLEIGIIRMICDEKTTEEMAKKFNVSKRTIGRYRERLLIKTGSRGGIGILKYAVENKLYVIP